jgi:hypothetical protein
MLEEASAVRRDFALALPQPVRITTWQSDTMLKR